MTSSGRSRGAVKEDLESGAAIDVVGNFGGDVSL